MNRKPVVSVVVALVFGLGSAVLNNVTQAGSFWDVMSPERCFGDDDDAWEYRGYSPGRHYAAGPYGWSGPYGWGGAGYPGYYGYPYAAVPRTTTAQRKAPPPKLPE